MDRHQLPPDWPEDEHFETDQYGEVVFRGVTMNMNCDRCGKTISARATHNASDDGHLFVYTIPHVCEKADIERIYDFFDRNGGGEEYYERYGELDEDT